MIARHPDGSCAGEVREECASNADVYPTICDAAGVEYDAEALHGRSLLPLTASGRGRPDSTKWRDCAVTEFSGVNSVSMSQRTIRMGALKYGWNAAGEDELYDLARDPHETVNVLRQPDYREDAMALRERLFDWMRETGDPVRGSTRRMPCATSGGRPVIRRVGIAFCPPECRRSVPFEAGLHSPATCRYAAVQSFEGRDYIPARNLPIHCRTRDRGRRMSEWPPPEIFPDRHRPHRLPRPGAQRVLQPVFFAVRTSRPEANLLSRGVPAILGDPQQQLRAPRLRSHAATLMPDHTTTAGRGRRRALVRGVQTREARSTPPISV